VLLPTLYACSLSGTLIAPMFGVVGTASAIATVDARAMVLAQR
jgi:hypothetical protein